MDKLNEIRRQKDEEIYQLQKKDYSLIRGIDYILKSQAETIKEGGSN